MLFKWVALQHIKQANIDECVKHNRRIANAGKFIKRQKAVVIYKAIYDKLRRIQILNKQRMNAMFFCLILKSRIKHKYSIRGKNPETRSLITGVNIMTFIGNARHDSTTEHASAVLKAFLVENDRVAGVRTKI